MQPNNYVFEIGRSAEKQKLHPSWIERSWWKIILLKSGHELTQNEWSPFSNGWWVCSAGGQWKQYRSWMASRRNSRARCCLRLRGTCNSNTIVQKHKLVSDSSDVIIRGFKRILSTTFCRSSLIRASGSTWTSVDGKVNMFSKGSAYNNLKFNQ